MANHTKLTEETANAILAAIQLGNHPETACISNGVTYRTWCNWKRKAKEGIEPFVEFFQRVRQSEATAESSLVVAVRAGAQHDPDLALKVLQSRFPKRWGNRVQIELRDMQELWMSTLERVLGDPAIRQRLSQGEDPGLVLTAFCEELASLDGEDEASPGESQESDPVH